MNYRLSDAAVDDLQAAVDHYGSISRGLAISLIEDVARCLKLISNNPYVGRTIGERFRRIPLNHYPFFLIYQVESEHVFVVSVYHQKRHPEYWRDRIQEEAAIYRLAA